MDEDIDPCPRDEKINLHSNSVQHEKSHVVVKAGEVIAYFHKFKIAL